MVPLLFSLLSLFFLSSFSLSFIIPSVYTYTPNSVERAIYSPLFSILKFYSTKLENATLLDEKITNTIHQLNQRYLMSRSELPGGGTLMRRKKNATLPQHVFHLNFISTTNWADAVLKMRAIRDSKSELFS